MALFGRCWTPSDITRLWVRRFWVFHFVCLGWVLFNSETLDRTGDVLLRLFTGWGTGPELLNPLVALAIAAALAAQFFPRAWADRGSGALANAPLSVTPDSPLRVYVAGDSQAFYPGHA